MPRKRVVAGSIHGVGCVLEYSGSRERCWWVVNRSIIIQPSTPESYDRAPSEPLPCRSVHVSNPSPQHTERSAYPYLKALRPPLLHPRQHHRPSTRLLPIFRPHVHLLEHRTIENDTMHTIGAHEDSCPSLQGFYTHRFLVICFGIRVGFGFVADVDLEVADASFFPLLFFKVEEFGAAGEDCFFVFFACLDCGILVSA
jgi:hypothetical protein